MTTTR